MVSSTTLLPSSIIHGPATPVASKKHLTDPKAEFDAKPVEQKMTVDNSAPQGQHISESERHRSTNPDGTEVLVTLQEDGVVTKNPIPPGHSKKLKFAIASAMTSGAPTDTPKTTTIDKIA